MQQPVFTRKSEYSSPRRKTGQTVNSRTFIRTRAEDQTRLGACVSSKSITGNVDAGVPFLDTRIRRVDTVPRCDSTSVDDRTQKACRNGPADEPLVQGYTFRTRDKGLEGYCTNLVWYSSE